MINPYYYLFYKLYSWNKRIGSKEDEEEDVSSAIFGLCSVFGLNIAIILFICLPDERGNFVKDYKVLIIVVYAVFYIFNLYLFNWKKRYVEIIKRYENESSLKREIGNVLVVTYIILSFLAIIFTAVLGNLRVK